MMRTHELKCWIGPFEAVVRGEKRFEYRKNDRGFQVSAHLLLREWEPDEAGLGELQHYTKRAVLVRVTYVLYVGFGLPPEYCIMSIMPRARCS